MYSDTNEEYITVSELLDTLELYFNSTLSLSTKRGDDRGDITNCLINGYLIQHKCDSSTWYAVYNSETNILLGLNDILYRRGGSVCPIQDFCIAHIAYMGKTYNDNSWSECRVFNKVKGKILTINLGLLVKMHFGQST